MKNIENLYYLQNISSFCEKNCMYRESDALTNSLIRLSYLFNSNLAIPEQDRIFPLDESTMQEYEDQDFYRRNFPGRYTTPDYQAPVGSDDKDGYNVESKLHGPGPVDGPLNVVYDASSSLTQGMNSPDPEKNWGKTWDEYDENNANGEHWKNYIPNNTY